MGNSLAQGAVRLAGMTFDFGGTLDGNGEHWFDRFRRLYHRVGVEVPGAQLRAACEEATRAAYAQRCLRSASFAELVEFHVRNQWHSLGRTWDALGSQIVRRFVEESLSQLRRSREILRELHRHVRLGVVSNFYGNLERVLQEVDLAPYLHTVVDSSVVGLRKPDPQIFHLTARKLGLAPAEILHVGDSLEQDVLAARRAGWQGAWLRGNQKTGAELLDGCNVLMLNSLEDLLMVQGPLPAADGKRGTVTERRTP